MAAPDDAAPAGGTGDSREGMLFAVSAYFLWGFLPLYLKAVAYIPSVEVLAHRIIWSVPVAGAVLVSVGRTADFRRAIRTPRMVAMAAMTACLISCNWESMSGRSRSAVPSRRRSATISIRWSASCWAQSFWAKDWTARRCSRSDLPCWRSSS